MKRSSEVELRKGDESSDDENDEEPVRAVVVVGGLGLLFWVGVVF